MGNDNVYSESGHLFPSTTSWLMGASRVQLVVFFFPIGLDITGVFFLTEVTRFFLIIQLKNRHVCIGSYIPSSFVKMAKKPEAALLLLANTRIT